MTEFNDDFNRANETLNKSGGNWIGFGISGTSSPRIVNNQVTTNDGGGQSAGGATYYYKESGIQSSQIRIMSINTVGTTIASVNVAVDTGSAVPGDSWNIFSVSSPAYYRFYAQKDGFRLRRRGPVGDNSFTTLQSAISGGDYIPQAGDVIKIEYEPATGIIRCRYGINGATPTINPFPSDYNDTGNQPPTTQQQVGFWVEDDATVDNWIGTWGSTASTVEKSSADSTQMTGTSAPDVSIPKLGGDSTSISSSEGGPRPPTADTPGGPSSIITEEFTAPNGTPLYSVDGGTKWTTNTATAPIINNNVLTTTTGAYAMLLNSYPGKQSAQLTIKKVGVSVNTIRGAVIVGAQELATTNNPYGNIGADSGEWYRLHYQSSRYELMVKVAGLASSYTSLSQINITPQDNDVIKLTYDPNDGRVEAFVNDMNTPVYSAIQTILPTSHTRVGMHIIGTDTEIDSFIGSWASGQEIPQGPGLYEFFASNDLRELNPYEVTAINSTTGARTLSQRDKSKIIVVGDTPLPVGQLPIIQPTHSDEFLNLYGINTGFNRDPIYTPNTSGGVGRRTQIYGYLEDLRIRHIRNAFTGSQMVNSSQREPFVYLYSKGIKVYAAQGGAGSPTQAGVLTEYASRNNTNSAWKSRVADMRSGFAWLANNPVASAVAGLNEPNEYSEFASFFAAATRDWQKEIWDAFNSVPELEGHGIYVAGPALMDEGGNPGVPVDPLFASNGAYGQLALNGAGQYMHRPQMHFYQPGTSMPEYSGNRTYQEFIDQQLKAAQWMAGESFVGNVLGGVVAGSSDGSAKRVDYTEFGWQAKPSNYSSTWSGYIEQEVGDLNVMRSILDPFIRSTGAIPNITYNTGQNPAQNSMGRSFLFDLVDEFSGQYFDSQTGRPQQPFGLVAANNVPKPSYVSLKALNLLLEDRSGGGQSGSVTHWTPPTMQFDISYTEPTSGTYTIGGIDNGGLRYRVLAKRDGTKMVLMYRATRPWKFDSTNPGKQYGLPTLNVTLQTVHATTDVIQSRTVAVGGFPIIVHINADNSFNYSKDQNGIYRVVRSASSLTDW